MRDELRARLHGEEFAAPPPSLVVEVPPGEAVPEPIPITVPTDPATAYPLDALGDILGSAASAIAEHAQVPQAMAGQSALSAAALAVQPYANVEINGDVSPVSLNALTISISGDRKTRADRLALRAHHGFQREQWRRFEVDCQRYKSDLSDWTSLSPRERGGIERPTEPVPPIFLCEEPTLEGLHKSFRVGKPSQGLFSDEGGQFFGGHAMNRDNGLKTITGLSRLWDGSPIGRTRAGAGESFMLYGRRLSCHLMLQPAVAAMVLGDAVLWEQGILARFLLTAPDSLQGTRLYREARPDQDPRLTRYWARMTEMLTGQWPINDTGELTPPTITCEPAAKSAWIEVYNAIETRLRTEYSEIRPTAAKAAENVLRIAAVISLTEGRSGINRSTLLGAARLIDHYLSETLRIRHRAEPDKELVEAEKLLSWLKVKGHKQFSPITVYKNGPAFTRSARKAKRLLAVLEKHGWIVAAADGWRLRDEK
jgi:hypothetical protein